jgi:arylsulfatase A-like enzyme
MKNRCTVVLLSLSLGSGFAPRAVSQPLPSFKGSRPNVVFFLADDQSIFDHSAYGNRTVPTPVTDAFAREGLVFEKAFTGQAICAPSRSMLYTGLYPLRNGCFINHTSIRPGIEPMPVQLKRHGYEVVIAGKTHVKPMEQFGWTAHFPPENRRGLPRPWIPVDRIDQYLGQVEKPFCLVVASAYPHSTYIKNTPYNPEDVLPPPFLQDTPGIRGAYARYYASIAEKEREFVAVLDLLDKHGLRENTVVFYSDDHGVERGKFTVYDSGLNMAFMVRWPGKIKPGRTSALTSYADFFPTVMELAGAKVPEGLDGKSLLPVLEGRSSSNHDHVYGLSHTQGIQNRHVYPRRSVHDGRYHYIFNFNSMERIERERTAGNAINYFIQRGAETHPADKEEMLFDSRSDLYQQNNLAGDPDMDAVRLRLKNELFRWMETQNDFLSEGGDIPFLKVAMHDLDQPDPRFGYEIPAEQIGALAGLRLCPHAITQPEASGRKERTAGNTPQEFQPRKDYQARLEPEAHVLHGAGQVEVSDFLDYCEALGNEFPPVLFMDYVGAREAGRWFSDRLSKKLDAFPHRTMVQLGLAMTVDDRPENRYEHEVAAGKYDANLKELFEGLKKLNVPIYVRIGYEANGYWNGYQPESYKKAFRRVTTLMRESGLNAATVWCIVPHPPDEETDMFSHAMEYYPGDEWVDWWAADLFTAEQIENSKPFLREADVRNKPVMIGESTPRGVGVLDGQQSWGQWFAPYFRLIRDHPGIKAFCYINWDWSEYTKWDYWGDARLGQNKVVAELYRNEMALPLYMHSCRMDWERWDGKEGIPPPAK